MDARTASSGCRSSTRSTSAPSAIPRVPDHISARELILPLRQRLRPIRQPAADAAAARHHLAARERRPADIDMICVRENSEGEYCGIGGRLHAGTPTRSPSRPASSRAAASSASRATPSSWRNAAAEAARQRHQVERAAARDGAVGRGRRRRREGFPDVELRKYHVDALAARMVTHPQTLDVIVASNLFGDILTDIGSAISGSLGVAPGGNINPERTTRPRCSSRFTGRRRTSPARGSPTRSRRSGPAR